jgi:hypothetical protein
MVEFLGTISNQRMLLVAETGLWTGILYLSYHQISALSVKGGGDAGSGGCGYKSYCRLGDDQR